MAAKAKCKPKSKCAPKSKSVRCAGNTKEGKRCKNSASGKSKFCASHKKK